MWDRPGTSNLNISHRLSPCHWLGLRRLCPVCRTEASSTMRIYRSWCHSRRHLRRWQTDTAFWHSHFILLGICQNSATRTVRRCSKDAVLSGLWILMDFLHTSPCLIHLNICIIWSKQCCHFDIVSVPQVPRAVLICEAIGLRPCPGTVQEEARLESMFSSCKALAQACEWFSRARQHNVWPGLRMVHLEIFRSPWPVLQWNKRISLEVESLLNLWQESKRLWHVTVTSWNGQEQVLRTLKTSQAAIRWSWSQPSVVFTVRTTDTNERH